MPKEVSMTIVIHSALHHVGIYCAVIFCPRNCTIPQISPQPHGSCLNVLPTGSVQKLNTDFMYI